MGLLINKTDFTGKYALGKTNFDSIDAYIARYEEPLLIDLLGVELFKLFKADVLIVPPVPSAAIYLAIYNPIRIDDIGNCPAIRVNNGMKSMLIGLIWFEYLRDLKIKMTAAGPAIDEVEVSVLASTDFMYQRYNEAVKDWGVIEWFIEQNIDDYPLYNGQKKLLAHWSL
jgi:hypothetical protein